LEEPLLWDRFETEEKVAKPEPLIERLAGAVAPKSIQLKASRIRLGAFTKKHRLYIRDIYEIL